MLGCEYNPLYMTTHDMTRGAMVCALYAILLLINQQTALMLENSLTWIFIFPIYLYAAQAPAAISCCVAAAMALESFLFGGFTTWFYSWTSIATGLAGGIALHKQAPSSWRLLIMFVIQFIGTMLILFLWAGIFDMDLTEDFAMIKAWIPWLDPWVFTVLFAAVMAFTMALCVHVVGAAACRKLNIPTRPLTPVSRIKGHRAVAWAFLVTLALFFLFPDMVLWKIEVRNLLILALVPELVYLDYYGAICVLRRLIGTNKRFLVFFVIMGTIIPGVQMILAAIGLLHALRGN